MVAPPSSLGTVVHGRVLVVHARQGLKVGIGGTGNIARPIYAVGLGCQL
jgi:hypothetical protein